jgi:hypothetical protein
VLAQATVIDYVRSHMGDSIEQYSAVVDEIARGVFELREELMEATKAAKRAKAHALAAQSAELLAEANNE